MERMIKLIGWIAWSLLETAESWMPGAMRRAAEWAAPRLEREGVSGAAARSFAGMGLKADAARLGRALDSGGNWNPGHSRGSDVFWLDLLDRASARNEGLARSMSEETAARLIKAGEAIMKDGRETPRVERAAEAIAAKMGAMARKAPKDALRAFRLLSSGQRPKWSEEELDALKAASKESGGKEALLALEAVGFAIDKPWTPWLIRKEAGLKALARMSAEGIWDSSGWARLCVDENRPEGVFGAREAGAPIDEPGEDGRTPIQEAARRGLGPASRALVACGADPTKKAKRARKAPIDRVGAKMRGKGGVELDARLEGWDIARSIEGSSSPSEDRPPRRRPMGL